MTSLARLSFWVRPERMADFGAVYEEQVAPHLAERDLENLAAAGHPCQRLHFYTPEIGQASESKLYLVDPGERLPQRKRRA